MKKRNYLFALPVLLAGILFATPVYAESCISYSGDNVEDQNYSYNWSSTVKSYLEALSDGELMRVQAGMTDDTDKLWIEYYDENYNLLSAKTISLELPVFGAFYATDTNYFVLTGQNNPDESDDLEVFCITKYDKDWNVLGSTGLYGANTTVPFDAGSARMDICGKYLLIRTSHEMYQSSDGINHQANVTIEVDTETMEITDSFTGILNSSYGYVSHSFNQFIKVENGKIIAVDHGDAHPRSIALINYQTDVTSGTFFPNYYSKCQVTNVLSFAGDIGNNITGATVGGFEISDSAYLIAGNSVVQDEDNLSRTTKNIFVAAVNKSDSSVTMNWITSFKEGDSTTTTPQFVKIDNNHFILLWSRNNVIYYTTIDGNGKVTGSQYTLNGNLSDCVPVISGNKLIWYVWYSNIIQFYEINLNNLSDSTVTEIACGHDYTVSGTVTNGQVTLVCGRCGKITEETVPTSLATFWTEANGGALSYFESNWPKNKQMLAWLYFFPENTLNDIEVLISDKSVCSYRILSENTIQFTALKVGTTNITIQSRWNPDCKQTFQLTVEGYKIEFFLPDTSVSVEDEEESLFLRGILPDSVFTDVFSAESSGSYHLKLLSASGDTLSDTTKPLKTGDIAQVFNGTTMVEQSVIVVKGDVNGDGLVNVLDMEEIQKDLLNISKLEGAYQKAANILNGTSISVLDMEAVQKHILRIELIK